jgi:microcystin-dependent protein
MPAHTHAGVPVLNGPGGTNNGDAGDSGGTTDSTGGGAVHNNLQPYIVLTYIIKK